MFGIIYPNKITERNWTPEAEEFVGKLVPADDVVESILEEDWFIIIDKKLEDEKDPYWLPQGCAIHQSCLVEVYACGCEARVLIYAGCVCGGFQNEQAFYSAFKKQTKK
jgi:hypothetical protein